MAFKSMSRWLGFNSQPSTYLAAQCLSFLIWKMEGTEITVKFTMR